MIIGDYSLVAEKIRACNKNEPRRGDITTQGIVSLLFRELQLLGFQQWTLDETHPPSVIFFTGNGVALNPTHLNLVGHSVSLHVLLIEARAFVRDNTTKGKWRQKPAVL